MTDSALLLDVCDMRSGGTPRRGTPGYFKGSIPWATISDMSASDGVVRETVETITKAGLDAIGNRLFDEGTILLAMYGSVGKLAVAGRALATNQAILGIRPRDPQTLDPQYLRSWLASIQAKLVLDARGVTQANISKSIVEQLRIPLPPLDEQRRIAKLLDAADELRAKRRKALGQVDALAQSVFIDLFGDPVTNPKGWDTLDGGEMFAELTYGTSRKSMDAPTATAVPVLRIPNIIGGEITWSDLKYTVPTKAELATLALQVDDLLFVRSNGNPDYIGRCARFSEPGRSPCLFASYLIRGRISKSVGVEAEYLKHHIEFPSYRHEVRKEARTTAGNFNLSTAGIRKFRFMKPPVRLQREFASLIACVEQQRARNRAHLNELDALFASLQSRAFKGEL